MVRDVVRQRSGDGSACLGKVVADLADGERGSGRARPQLVVVQTVAEDAVQTPNLGGRWHPVVDEPPGHIVDEMSQLVEGGEGRIDGRQRAGLAKQPACCEPRAQRNGVTDLQAEMRQQDLLAEAGRPRLPRRTGRRRTFLGLPIPGRRPRD